MSTQPLNTHTKYQDFLSQIGPICDQSSRAQTTTSVKAVKFACDGLLNTDSGWVGGPPPFLIESKDSTNSIVDKVKPLNAELAQAIRDLHTGTQKITRNDLAEECNPTCGPCTDSAQLKDLKERQCFNHPQELHVSTESANQFIYKAKTLLETKPELEPKTEESTSSFVVPTLIVLAIAVVGIASFKLYSQMKKQEEKKIQ